MELLKKTIRSYFLVSVIILLVAIPIFYLTLKKLLVKNIDEDLIATKTLLIPRLRNVAANKGQGGVLYRNYDIQYEKTHSSGSGDSISTVEVSDSFSNELIQQRLLTSQFIVNKESYRLKIKISMADKNSLMRRIAGVAVIMLFLLLLGLLIINKVLSKKIWRPFYNTLLGLHEYRVDRQPALHLEKSSVKEFNDLNKAIEQLTQRDYQAYISQKEFAENASHEMQSPLAVFQSKLELLMQTKPLNEEQASLIEDLANASERMARLNKSLILLTKIENNQFLEKETVSLEGILKKLKQQYEFQIDQKSIQVEFQVEKDIEIEANRTLTEILISNLLSNAIRHNVQNGRIVLSLRTNELVVQNSGKPYSLDVQKLFQRFQKDSFDSGSIGLGLEIVKKICDLNHYSIKYQYINQLHTFSVQL
jgi:signal transduction histidine kinase